ncbi:MAG: heme exporter protein CcmD [Rhizobium sp.]|jgi:heme exporter protein D|uniref:heme exporter protein CcmD n=1 Tax=Thiobacillus sp. TaxID=924 RepID=UPI0025FBA627|nr:heme exporter protein CcmD [Thiobacillus sp.]MBW8362947.1 heme exporter protein CcmD [Rhizobium sp.]
MNWKSLGDFIAMGGYGFYVWGAYLVTAALITAEILMLRLRRRAVEKARRMQALLSEQVKHETTP